MIISGLEETFIKRFVVERTNKAEIRQEEQNEKAVSCWENLRNSTPVRFLMLTPDICSTQKCYTRTEVSMQSLLVVM